jgi:hypothetical protein
LPDRWKPAELPDPPGLEMIFYEKPT